VAASVCLLPAAAVAFGDSQIPVFVLAAAASAGLAVGWPRLAHIPGTATATGLLGAAGAVNLVVAWQAHDAGPQLLALVLALAVLAAFLREAIRGEGRTGLVASLAATVTGLALTTAVSAWTAVAGDGLGAVIALATGVVAGAGTAGAGGWRRLAARPALADLARVVVPMALGGPVAWLATLLLG
jgi:hypothetical protein